MDTEERELDELKKKIHRERGFNCHFYKDKCLRRRLAVRMRARGAESFRDYAELLDLDPAEYELLLDALTINVTKFFRNAETWSMMEREVLPRLFDGPERTREIWSAGCASGEEAYSLSILLRQWAERHDRADALARFRIRGTDIDRRSLLAAEHAEYPDLSLVETAEDVRERWFSPGPPYRLDPSARENVSFAWHDMISGEPPREQSMILCRNVIIYFDRDIQETLFQRFHDALLPGGVLVLGKVETLLGASRSLFRPLSNRERIFLKPA